MYSQAITLPSKSSNMIQMLRCITILLLSICGVISVVQAFSPCSTPSSIARYQLQNTRRRHRAHASRRLRLFYTYENTDNNSDDLSQTSSALPQSTFTMDTSQILSDLDVKNTVFEWLASLNGVERSDPTWISNRFLTTLSPSSLLQEHLESLLPTSLLPSSISTALFPTEWSRHKFDCDWREGFLRTMPSDILSEIHSNSHPMSNTHPLRLQLVAIPPETALQKHIHAAVEFNVPLLGGLWERVPVKNGEDTTMPAHMLERPAELQIGTPLNDFEGQPTPTELETVKLRLQTDLQCELQQIVENDAIVYEERVIPEGACLVNLPGSIHQSFTKATGDKKGGGCLLWALGPNLHVHFPS